MEQHHANMFYKTSTTTTNNKNVNKNKTKPILERAEGARDVGGANQPTKANQESGLW